MRLNRTLSFFSSELWTLNTLIETCSSGFQVTAHEKNVEPRKDKHLMEQYFRNVKLIIRCQRTTQANVSWAPQNVVCFSFLPMNRKANQQQILTFFFYSIYLLIYFVFTKTWITWTQTQFQRGDGNRRCSVSFLFMRRRYSALSIFNSVLLGFRRECIESDSPPETFSEPNVRSCERAALLDWRPDCPPARQAPRMHGYSC